MGVALRLCCVLGLLCGLLGFAPPARAERADDDCADQMTRVDVAAEVGRVEMVEAIVPCAMVESGALGPDCHDAAFYVVNTQGTLLCRVDVALVTGATTSDRLEDGPPASPTSLPPHLMAASVVHVALPGIPPPAVAARAPAHGPPGLDGGRDVVGSTPRPS